MSGFSEVIQEYIDEKLTMTHTAMLGRLTSVTETEADVQPLQGGFPLLKGLPVLKQSYVYEEGDTVLVVFLERARDGAGQRKHSLEDGIVVGVVK